SCHKRRPHHDRPGVADSARRRRGLDTVRAHHWRMALVPGAPGTEHPEAATAPAPLPEETMTPADLFERYWSRARRILVAALLVLGALLALAGYLILA
ncbi:MAG: hypothetical protein KF890_15625, partial [Nitrospira sp.]|nr:hypothetical protein [Nitrospira sp.]